LAHVSVTINGRIYQIACDDGQEANLTRLADYVDKRVGELVAAVGQVGDDRLLVMASLLVADELSDAATRLDGLDGPDDTNRLHDEEALIANIDTLAERIENIAQRLEQS
jgi:cell division protein ZapA